MLSDLALRRLRLLRLTEGQADTKKKLVFLSELASLGYLVENPEEYNDSILYNYPALIEQLKALRGGQADYVPLFQGFPNDVPNELQYYVHRMLGFLVNHCLSYPRGTRLESGVVVPEWLFELKEFGADPITQMQDPALHRASAQAQKQRAGDRHVEWVSLRFAGKAETEERALAFLRGNLYARSSIQESLRPDLEWLLGFFSPDRIDPTQVVFRETRTYLMKYYWEKAELAQVGLLASTPTDFLRLFAALTGGDVSLATKIKFPKLTQPQRRLVLDGLERAGNLAEDLRRYRGLWLALGRGLHPGARADRYARTAEAFAGLRNGGLATFNTPVERAFQERRSLEIVPHLQKRPALLARRLQQLLNANPEHSSAVLEQFAAVAEQVPFKNLLILKWHFQHAWQAQHHTVINKKGKIRVGAHPPRSLKGPVLEPLLQLLQQTMKAQLGKRASWAGRSCWIDPRLLNYTVPLQQRKASDGMLTLGRGTRLPLDVGKVLRLFVYWKQRRMRTDLDLSVIQFDSEMNYTGHVSYTRLAGEGLVHSGDIQSAPLGAAEFIDVDLARLTNCRYIAPQIYRYCGHAFGDMQCHSGWMIRDRIDASYQSFDIKTVQNKFDLTGSGSYCLPIVVDLHNSEIIYVDLYVGAVEQHNRVEGAVQDISVITREMVRMGQIRPNLYDLAVLHREARGAQAVEAREQAELTFGLTGCDYSVDRVEKLLSELL